MSSLEDAIDLTDDHALAAGIYRSEQRAQLAAEQRRRAEAAMSAEELVRELDEEDDDAGMPELVQGDAAALLAASAIAEATTAALDVASTELHRFDAAYVPTVHQQQSDILRAVALDAAEDRAEVASFYRWDVQIGKRCSRAEFDATHGVARGEQRWNAEDVMRPTAAVDGQPLIGTPVRRAPDGGFYTEAEFNAYFNDEGYAWACALGYGPYKSYLLGNAKNAIGYVGICKDVPMRLGEHNGDLGSLDRGAHVTKRFRPWSVRIIMDGLFTRRDAGAFEWAWQRPFDAPSMRLRRGGLKGSN